MLEIITLPKPKIVIAIIFAAEVSTKDRTCNFPHYEGQISIDTTPTHIKVQELEIAQWTLPKYHQVWLHNLETIENLQTIKLNVTLARPIATNIKTLFKGYKGIFAWNYTNFKGIPPQIV